MNTKIQRGLLGLGVAISIFACTMGDFSVVSAAPVDTNIDITCTDKKTVKVVKDATEAAKNAACKKAGHKAWQKPAENKPAETPAANTGPNNAEKVNGGATFKDQPIKCTILIDLCANTGGGNGIVKNSGMGKLLIYILNILTAGVGVAAVGGIVWASLLYSSSGDNAQQTKKAKDTITQIVIGLVLYGFMFLILNFLIPGGVFN